MEVQDASLTPLHPDHVKVVRWRLSLFSIPLVALTIALEAAGSLPIGAFAVPLGVGLVWLVLRLPIRLHRARGYTMMHDRLRVVRGRMFHHDTWVPFSRVQHIDVARGPLEQRYGLATLVVHTAGTHNSSVRLPGLVESEALAMREMIRAAIAAATE